MGSYIGYELTCKLNLEIVQGTPQPGNDPRDQSRRSAWASGYGHIGPLGSLFGSTHIRGYFQNYGSFDTQFFWGSQGVRLPRQVILTAFT